MAKKSNKAIRVATISKEDRFHAEKERFNPYQGGYGPQKDKKKHTRKEKYKQRYV